MPSCEEELFTGTISCGLVRLPQTFKKTTIDPHS
jgi:hypothetical protein